MDFYRILSPIYEICDEDVEEHQKNFINYKNEVDYDWSDINVRGVSFKVSKTMENLPADRGNMTFGDEKGNLRNESEPVSPFGSDLDVIHEDTPFKDRISSLRYFLNDQGASRGLSTPQVPQKIQQDPLIRHWIDLCTENKLEKNELDMELFGYTGRTGESWEECVEKRLDQLHEKQARLDREIRKQLDFLARVPEGDGTVQELAYQLQEIYRNSSSCYSNFGDVIREVNETEESNSAYFENKPVGLASGSESPICHAGSKEKSGMHVQFDEVAQENVSNEINHCNDEHYFNEENQKLISKSQTNDWCRKKESENEETKTIDGDRKMKAEFKDPCKALFKQTGFLHNDDTAGCTRVKLPPIHANVQKKGVAGFPSQQSKSVCRLPEIGTSTKLSRSIGLPSSSDSNQNLGRGRESPMNPRTQNRPESKRTTRTLLSPMSRDHISRAGTTTGSKLPNILPPLMNIPKSFKEIRDFFQVPKRKGAKKTHNCDILIIEHDNHERMASVQKQPDRRAPVMNKLSSISEGNFLQNELIRNEDQALYYKSERAEKILVSNSRRHTPQ